MKFVLASIFFILFMMFISKALDKVRVDHKEELDRNPIFAKRFNRFSMATGFLGLLSFACFFASVVYLILK